MEGKKLESVEPRDAIMIDKYTVIRSSRWATSSVSYGGCAFGSTHLVEKNTVTDIVRKVSWVLVGSYS